MINSIEEFELKFGKILKEKSGLGIPRMRIYMEEISEVSDKIAFLIDFYQNFGSYESFFLKLLFWENPNQFIKDVICKEEPSSLLNFSFCESNDPTIPNVMWFNGETLDVSMLKEIVLWHFNYEMAKDPSCDMRVQFCLYISDKYMLWDVYDDRGCDVYWIENGTAFFERVEK